MDSSLTLYEMQLGTITDVCADPWFAVQRPCLRPRPRNLSVPYAVSSALVVRGLDSAAQAGAVAAVSIAAEQLPMN
jgi:hypothetical protein